MLVVFITFAVACAPASAISCKVLPFILEAVSAALSAAFLAFFSDAVYPYIICARWVALSIVDIMPCIKIASNPSPPPLCL